MRKVNITVTATVMVPMTVTYEGVVTVDEGVSMERAAKALISGNHDRVTIEDSSIKTVTVDGSDHDESLEDQVSELLTDSEGPNIRYVSHEVTDSR